MINSLSKVEVVITAEKLDATDVEMLIQSVLSVRSSRICGGGKYVGFSAHHNYVWGMTSSRTFGMVAVGKHTKFYSEANVQVFDCK